MGRVILLVAAPARIVLSPLAAGGLSWARAIPIKRPQKTGSHVMMRKNGKPCIPRSKNLSCLLMMIFTVRELRARWQSKQGTRLWLKFETAHLPPFLFPFSHLRFHAIIADKESISHRLNSTP